MKNSNRLPNLLKGAILILLMLNLIFMLWQPAEASQKQITYQKKSNSIVLMMARNYEAKGDWANAYAYYSIYLDREPQDAKDDTAFWSDLNRRWERTQYNAVHEQFFANDVRNFIIDRLLPRQKFVEAGVRGTYTNPPSPISGTLGPAPDEILVYVDNDFGGSWMSLPIGNYYNAGQMQMPDNSLSSAKVGRNVRAYLCENNDLTGRCQFFVWVPNQHPILAQTVGNDIVSSIRVERNNSCAHGPDEIAIFLHANYEAPCQVVQIDEYYNSGAFNLPNDSISSVKVGNNVQLILCEHHNFSGICETFTFNDSNLGDNSIGSDRVSSIRVEPRP